MRESLRVAFLSEHASPAALLGGVDAGGQNVYVDEVARGLGRLGHRVDIFTRREAPDAPALLEWAPGVRIVNLDVGPAAPVFKDRLWPLMPAFCDQLARFMLRDGARYDLLHGNFWMSGWAATRLAEELAIPAVQIFHAMGMTKRREQGEADTSPAERIDVEAEVVARADRIIAQCPAERDELIDDYGCDPRKIALVPSATNVERFRPVPQDEARRRLGISPDALVIVYVGRMLPRKDVRNIVRALALLPERGLDPEAPERPLRLLLVGGESLEPDRTATPEIGVLQDLAAELGVAARVSFVGKRQPEVLRDYYSAGDVAVTTPWYEPFGLTPLEAMACGRPVIGAAVGGIGYTVEDGVTGLLVPPRNPPALAAALRRLFERPALREQMGHAARARVEREFSWPTVAARTAALYRELVEAGRQPIAFKERTVAR
jgi:D-inositol-3-phosphate glycosyltransferase